MNQPEGDGGFARGQARTLAILLTLVSAATLAAVWWYYSAQRREVEEAATRELASVTRAETGQIANWRRERLGDGRVLMASHAMRTASLVISGAASNADRADLHDLLARMSHEFQYAGAILVDLDGKPKFQLEGAGITAVPQSPRWRDLARQAQVTGDVMLSDLGLEPGSHKPMMEMIVPVRGSGALILEIDPDQFLYPYIATWPGPSLTAEVLLVRRDGNDIIYLNPRRHLLQAPLFSRRTAPVRIPSDAILEAGWTIKTTDYRGQLVLGAARHIPGSPWYLVCKIDEAEVDAPLRRVAWEMGIIAALIAFANVVGVALIWRDQRARSLRELSALLIGAQEEERARLARELHDDVNQRIAAVAIAMGNLKRQIPEEQAGPRAQSDRIHDKLVQLTESVRRLSHELHPAVLEHAGLPAAMRAYAEEFGELTGVEVALAIRGSFEGVPAPAALCIYRIGQEALQNVAKHANVKAASVELNRTQGHLRIVVSDAGRGMVSSHRRGLGLVSIHERARLAHGAVKVESHPNHGTTVTVTIPG